jgi:hypothetical protein|tara:strand:+ start:324 stop:614 length:291 start_codon:yes stop_codon:yes gene_type:complete
MTVKLIRMWSGEDVIADLVKETEDSITIVNPIVAIPSGQGNIGFAPWSPILKGDNTQIEVTKKYVVYISETQDEIIEQYNQMYAPIAIPPKKKLIL